MRTTTEFPDTYFSSLLFSPLIVQASGDIFTKLITITNTSTSATVVVNISTGDGVSAYFSVWMHPLAVQQFYHSKFTDGLRIVGTVDILATGSIMPPQTI